MSEISQSSTQPDNAMTEIALALAMGFFSIMVLTMVSMGAGQVASASKDIFTPTQIEAEKIEMANVEPDTAKTSTAPTAPSDVIVHYNGAFFDAELNAIDPSAFAPTGNAVLALDPSLSMSDAMAVRARVGVPNLTVTTLTENWITRLKEVKP
jgi:hypothetical protein